MQSVRFSVQYAAILDRFITGADMRIRSIIVALLCAGALVTLAACSGNPAVGSAAQRTDAPGAADASATAAAPAQVGPAAAASSQGTRAAAATPVDAPTAASAQRLETPAKTPNPPLDAARTTRITLDGAAIQVAGGGVTVKGSQATITAAGVYRLSGALADGQIVVNTADKAPVNLILDGVTLSNAASAPIYIMKAQEAVILLADGSENRVSDGKSYVFVSPSDNEPNAAIFSKADLTISGGGSLTVIGNYNDGITGKDDLTITGGTIAVTAVDDGIRGKGNLIIQDGAITVQAAGDGLKADNAEDPARGNVSVAGGVIAITAGGDAISAEQAVTIAAGRLTLVTGGGHQANLSADTSAKGLKGLASIVIDGGTFAIDSADDAIHSNNSIVINGGTFEIATGDDGVHADASLTINGGDLRINRSYEGIESAVITINDGKLRITASDDGLNVAGESEGGGLPPGPGGKPGPGGRPGRGGPGQSAESYTGKQYLYINGGYIAIEAAGDGIDVNGAISMTAGTVIVHGPIQQFNSALDYDAFFNISGGFVVAAGSAGMAQAPGGASTQNSLLLNLTATQKAGVLFHIQTSDGKEVLTFAPAKPYQSIAFSSPALLQGVTYDVYLGGSSTGEAQDGLYQGGTYTPGTKYTSFTVSSTVTTIGGRMR